MFRPLPDATELPPQSTDTSTALNKRRAQVARYAKLLLGCFRTGDATDPEVYAGAVIIVLADYPDDVIERVVDPRHGLPSRMNWLPTIAEIKSACEDLYGHRRRIAEWEDHAKLQIEARKQILISDGRAPEQKKARIAELAQEAIRQLGHPLRKGYYREEGDGKHASRVEADLAMRRAVREAKARPA